MGWTKEFQDEVDDYEAITCPECGCDRIRYVEDISCYREVLGRDPGNDSHDERVVVDGLYKTEGYDEEATNQRFQCAECCHEWLGPGLDGIEFV